jgi:hypothetical protein
MVLGTKGLMLPPENGPVHLKTDIQLLLHGVLRKRFVKSEANLCFVNIMHVTFKPLVVPCSIYSCKDGVA